MLDWSVNDAWQVNVQWLNVAGVFDSAVPTGGRMLSGYDRIDAQVAWQISDKLQTWLAIDNVSDETYEEAIGFRAPGSRARLGLRIQL